MDEYEESKKKTKRYRKIKVLLKEVFGHESFRIKQYEIINRIICGEDVCGILSTGFGKSLLYQLPAIYLDKPAIVISPLISLMDDQRMILEDLGISTCCYNSTATNKTQLKKEILEGAYKFIYITPESIVSMSDFLVTLEETQGISLIAIDEAHCISAYGHDFRKSYRQLTFFKAILPETPILAVTATATNTIAYDIIKVLDLKTEEPIKTSFDRPNLYIEVNRKRSKIKGGPNPLAQDILPIINKYAKEAVIIYCLTKKETVKIAEMLKKNKIKFGIYHAGLEADEKSKTHHDFIKGKINVVVATIAFGMGINKSNVRAIIHYGAPRNMEGYYQEIGRAGRDGEKSYCYLFYNTMDFRIQEIFINQIHDDRYKMNQLKMLELMKRFVASSRCRKQILLEYFDEDMENKCGFCDNCCGKVQKVEQEVFTTEQNVQKEAKLLIELIESIKDRNFGVNMYVNILRGSKNKTITSVLAKNKFYGLGKNKSMDWWKELAENLIKQGFLQQINLSGKFCGQIVKVTKKGLTWASMSDLGEFLDGLTVAKLEPMKMISSS